MKAFKKIPATNRSISLRRMICGIGINDAAYQVNYTCHGKQIPSVSYKTWVSMIQRCYSVLRMNKYPSYKGCSVANEWLIFSNFDKWFELHHKKGLHLDKDIKIKGNKIYSPDTCLMVSRDINMLIHERHCKKGNYPKGVHRYKNKNKYRFKAQVRVDGEKKSLGYFDTPEMAHKAYVTAKNSEIERKAKLNPSIAVYLLQHKLREL